MEILKYATLLSVLFCGLIAGFFYAWVCSTMWGLDTLPPDAAIRAMNAMNMSVRNAVFFPSFMLTPVVLVGTGLLALFLGVKDVGIAFILAGIVYFGGAFMPTVLVNVPMNKALEMVQIPTDVESANDIWTSYSDRWQFWNSFRAVASGIALLMVGWGMLKMPSRVS